MKTNVSAFNQHKLPCINREIISTFARNRLRIRIQRAYPIAIIMTRGLYA